MSPFDLMVAFSDTVLSVIIVNRNTADLLQDCLSHVFESELDARLEVIVVDNGSTDNSVEMVKERFPGVKIIEAGRNLGFAAANNRAVAVAGGDFFLLVNTDAMIEPDCAKKLLQVMFSDPTAAMAGPRLFNSDGPLQTSYEAVPTLATEIFNRSLLKRLFPWRYPGKNKSLSAPEPVEALIGAVMLARRVALEEVGGFDENYFFFLEETDLAVRLRRRGWKVIHQPCAGAAHLQGATARMYNALPRIEFYRSRYLFFHIHYGKAAACLLRAVLFLNLALNVFFLAAATVLTLAMIKGLNGQLAVKWHLFWWHLQGCPEAMGLPRN